MATKQEWREYFELTQGRKPTLEEFQDAVKNGAITSEKTSQSSSNNPMKTTKKRQSWIWVLGFIVVIVLGIGGYVSYQIFSFNAKTAEITTLLKSRGYVNGGNQTQNGSYYLGNGISHKTSIGFSILIVATSNDGSPTNIALANKNQDAGGDSLIPGKWYIENKMGEYEVLNESTIAEIPYLK